MRARAKTNTDKMVTRKVSNEYSLGFRDDGADFGGMGEVEDEPEVLEGYVLEKITVPRLQVGLTRVSIVQET